MTPHRAEAVDLRHAAPVAEALLGQRGLPVSGLSMYPAIRPGDRLHLDRDRAPAPGDVVVLRRPEGLLCHRVVSLDPDLLLTRGDAREGLDRRAPRSTVLGVVARVERQRRWVMPVQRHDWSTRSRRWARQLVARAAAALRRRALSCLAWAQSLPPYRSMGRAFLAPRVRVRLLVPIRSGLFWRPLEPGEGADRPPSQVRLRASLLGVGVGGCSLDVLEGRDWFLANLRVRSACRGWGVADRIAREALRAARTWNARALRCHVAPDNEPSLRLFNRLGLREIS